MSKKTSLIILILLSSNSIAGNIAFKNRYFLKNKLMKVFGKEGESIILENLFFATNDLGGPCDIYSQVYNKADEVLVAETKCPGGKSGSKISMYGKNSPLRSAAILKTCHRLTQNVETKGHSLSKPVETAYNKFYPFDLDPTLKIAIKESLKRERLSDADKYKKALFLFCVSPKWQQI